MNRSFCECLIAFGRVCNSGRVDPKLYLHLEILLMVTVCITGLSGFTGLRKNASKARKAECPAHRSKQTVGRQSVRVAAEAQAPEWDKLSSDDFETWMDNGGPPTPLLVSQRMGCLVCACYGAWLVVQRSVECYRLNHVSRMECWFIAGHCQLPCASEELQSGAVEAAVQGAAL